MRLGLSPAQDAHLLPLGVVDGDVEAGVLARLEGKAFVAERGRGGGDDERGREGDRSQQNSVSTTRNVSGRAHTRPGSLYLVRS